MILNHYQTTPHRLTRAGNGPETASSAAAICPKVKERAPIMLVANIPPWYSVLTNGEGDTEMNALTIVTYNSRQYASNRDFIMQSIDPANTFAEAVESGEWTHENAWQQASDYLRYAVAEGQVENHDDDDREFTTNDLAAYIVSLIDEAATCDRCGVACGAENLTAQSSGQSICGGCEFAEVTA